MPSKFPFLVPSNSESKPDIPSSYLLGASESRFTRFPSKSPIQVAHQTVQPPTLPSLESSMIASDTPSLSPSTPAPTRYRSDSYKRRRQRPSHTPSDKPYIVPGYSTSSSAPSDGAFCDTIEHAFVVSYKGASHSANN
jgi:hypothetical protein